MGVLDNILAAKPLSSWQQAIKNEGRLCERCGAAAEITAPVAQDEELLRVSCPHCHHVSYEFPPRQAKIIRFEEIS